MFWPSFKQLRQWFQSILPLLVNKHVLDGLRQKLVNKVKTGDCLARALAAKSCSFPDNCSLASYPQHEDSLAPGQRSRVKTAQSYIQCSSGKCYGRLWLGMYLIHADHWFELSSEDVMLHPQVTPHCETLKPFEGVVLKDPIPLRFFTFIETCACVCVCVCVEVFYQQHNLNHSSCSVKIVVPHLVPDRWLSSIA